MFNGVICINKPKEYTSFDVVARMRGMSKTKKIGHSGTLDPMATGVLPLFFGTATKAISVLPDDDKSYRADFQLGCTSTTLDRWGEITQNPLPNFTQQDILDTLVHFRGEISQLPPMYSAVRVDGKRLYDLAREGKEVERKPKQVTIYKLELVSFDQQTQTGVLDIDCSKGTFIRTIIDDMGAKLGCGGIMTELARTFACGFSLDDCITLEEAQALTDQSLLQTKLLKIENVFYNLPKIKLNEIQSSKFKNGVKLDLNRVHHQRLDGFHSVYDNNNNFMGLASLDLETMSLKIEKHMVSMEV